MKDRRKQLKVKIKSLAEEARIIRLEERRAKERGDYRLYFELQRHRIGGVRTAARESQLAYHFVRGKGLDTLPEKTCRTRMNNGGHSIVDAIVRFGPVMQKHESKEDFSLRVREVAEAAENAVDLMSESIRVNILAYNQTAPERAERRRNRRAKCEEKHGQRRELPDGVQSVEKIAEVLGAEPVAEADMTPRESMFKRALDAANETFGNALGKLAK